MNDCEFIIRARRKWVELYATTKNATLVCRRCGISWRIRLIVLRENQTVIGSIDLKGSPRNGDAEIGWGVSPEYQRQGIDTVAALVLWSSGRSPKKA